MSTCRIHEIEKYEFVEQCSREALEHDPEGLCLLHSRKSNKDKDGAFTNAVKDKLLTEDYDFRGVLFPGPFYIRKFTNQEKFTFTKPALFFKASFKEEAHFTGAIFEKEAYFTGATFKKAYFIDSTFKQMANFDEVTFRKGAVFPKANFCGVANFNKTNFNEWANFKEADFAKEATFYSANFSDASFFMAKFFEKANFLGITFNGKADFIGANFSNETHFSRTKIKGSVIFNWINQPKDEIDKNQQVPLTFLPWSAVFHYVDIESLGLLSFEDLSLAKVEFAGTDLSRVAFHNVKWRDYRLRRGLYEEVIVNEQDSGWLQISCLLDPTAFALEMGPSLQPVARATFLQDEFARLERLYRELKVNYIAKGDYKQAGDFHFGEMEMYRKGTPERRWLSWHFLYWLLSGYGERPLRAIGWLTVLIFCLPLLVFLLGMRSETGGQVLTGLEGYWQTLVFLLEKAALQRPEWLKPDSGLSRFFIALSAILIPGQAALFILALRNRLGRRR